MTDFQIKRGSKNGLPKLLTGEFGLVTDQSEEELYIGGNSRNRRIPLVSDDGKLPINAYTKEESKSIFGLTESVTFDKNYIPLTTSAETSLSTGSFATDNTSIKYVYISSKVTSVSSGTFVGCTNLTDIYVDNTAGNISFPTNNLPRGAKVHYVDNFNANSYIIKALLALQKNLIEKGTTDLSCSTSDLTLDYKKCEYQRVGDYVIIQFKFNIQSTSSSTAVIQLTGLPFRSSSGPYSYGVSGVGISSKSDLFQWKVTDNSTTLTLTKNSGIWSSGEGGSMVAIYRIA